MEELAEATLLESLEENSVHEDHMEPQDDDAAGPVVAPVTDQSDHGAGPATVQSNQGAQPVTVQDQSVGDKPAASEAAALVGGASPRVTQVARGDISQTTFPPPEFCSGCGFIGDTSL